VVQAVEVLDQKLILQEFQEQQILEAAVVAAELVVLVVDQEEQVAQES